MSTAATITLDYPSPYSLQQASRKACYDSCPPFVMVDVTMIEILAITMVSVSLAAIVGALTVSLVARFQMRRQLTLLQP